MSDRSFPRAVVPLIAAAMIVFVLTVVIGILNGLDLWDVSHGALMAHVHAGTLGWITLSIFAGAAWVLDADRVPKALVWLSIAAVFIYVAAFFADATDLRPYAGSLMLLSMIWFTIWAFMARRGRPLTVPSLSVLLGLVNLVVGGILGVILGLMLAGVIDYQEGFAGAHPAMMVVGYLLISATGVAEQLVDGPGANELTRSGVTQAVLFFLAGIILAVGVLLDIQPLLGLNLLFEIIGVALVLVRNRKAIAGAGWRAESLARRGATSMLFLVPALAILGYLIVKYSEDIDAAPRGLFLALDHATFVGILTNAIFGVILVATAARRRQGSAADELVFWGTNVGLALFVVGLLADQVVIKRIGTPLMGLSILLGLGLAAARLSGGGHPVSAEAGSTT